MEKTVEGTYSNIAPDENEPVLQKDLSGWTRLIASWMDARDADEAQLRHEVSGARWFVASVGILALMGQVGTVALVLLT